MKKLKRMSTGMYAIVAMLPISALGLAVHSNLAPAKAPDRSELVGTYFGTGWCLPSSCVSPQTPYTADTWVVYGSDYECTSKTPPADANGRQWYEPDYVLTNSTDDILPDGTAIVWQNHTSPFAEGSDGYNYLPDCDTPGDIYLRRSFTIDGDLPESLYFAFTFDDSPFQFYLNGTLIYDVPDFWWSNYDVQTIALTPEQRALIHTDGTPNILAGRAAQCWGGYHIDCGLYSKDYVQYQITGEESCQVISGHFVEGVVDVPRSVSYQGYDFTVTRVNWDAFRGTPITRVNIPETVTEIEFSAFWDCGDVDVRAYVPVYGERALWCAPLDCTDFVLTSEWSVVHSYAFAGCKSLASVTLPVNIELVKKGAFSGCEALTDIYTEAPRAPEIADDAFDGLDRSKIAIHIYESAVESFKERWGEDFKYVAIADPEQVELDITVDAPGTLRSVATAMAAENAGNVNSIISLKVTGTINEDDLYFMGDITRTYGSLATLDLGDATVEGGWIRGFEGGEHLQSIILPANLEYIGEYAFANCDNLTAIDIPASVRAIREHAFYNCDRLASVTGCQGIVEAWLDNCEGPFFECHSLETPIYSETVFLYLPQSWKGKYEIPSTIIYTAGDCMRGCTGLTAVTIPAGVLELGNDTFRDCSGLTDVTCYAAEPPRDHDNSFYGVDMSQLTAYVPDIYIEDYRQASEWRDYGAILPIVTELYDLTVTTTAAGQLDMLLIDKAAADAGFASTSVLSIVFDGPLNDDDIDFINGLPATLYYLTTIDISASGLTEIAAEQFANARFKEIALPETLTAIGDRAFCGSRLLSVVIPDAVTAIGAEAFADMGNLQSVEFGQGSCLQSLGEYALRNTGISELILPDAVTQLGHRALQGCPNLTRIVLGSGINEVPECFAEYANNLKEVEFKGIIQRIGWHAFPGFNLTDVTMRNRHVPSIDDSFYGGINSEAVLHLYSNFLPRFEADDYFSQFNIVGDLGEYTLYSLTVNCADEGQYEASLQSAMQAAGTTDANDIIALTVTGRITPDELAMISALTRDNGALTHIDLSHAALTIDGEAQWMPGFMFAQSYIESISLPYNTVGLDYNVFEWSWCLTDVTLNESLEWIRSAAFRGTGITSIVIPDKVNGADDCVFEHCPNLRKIDIGKGLKSLHANLFCGSTDALEEIIIRGENVSLDWHVFKTTSLRDVTIYGRFVPFVSDDSFDGTIDKSMTLHVPADIKDKYEADKIWSQFTVVGDLDPVLPAPLHITVNVPQRGMFESMLGEAMMQAGCNDRNLITHLTVTGYLNDDDIRAMGNLSRGDGNLIDLDLGNAETEEGIPNDAFRDSYIRSIVIPYNTQFIDGGAFGGSKIESIDFNDAPIWWIKYGAFNGARYLTDVELPATLTWLEDFVFANCLGLQTVSIPASIETLGLDSFFNCPSLTDIYFYGTAIPIIGEEVGYDKSVITLHVYEELVEPMSLHELMGGFNIVGDLGSIGSLGEMAQTEYLSLCRLYQALDGPNWRRPWVVDANSMLQALWTGVTFVDGHVTSIRLNNNNLSGDITDMSLDLPYLTSLELYGNGITGDPTALAASLPALVTLNLGANSLSTVDGMIPQTVTGLNLNGQYYGNVGASTLAQARTCAGLPNIFYYNHNERCFGDKIMPDAGLSFSVLDDNGNERWEWRAEAGVDDSFISWGVFDYEQGVTVRVKDTQTWSTSIEFAYSYQTADANMDDAVNVMDLQSTLNYSHLYDDTRWEGTPFNLRAADTNTDGIINVLDIVTTVNTLLGITPAAAPMRVSGIGSDAQATVYADGACIALNSSREVAAVDMYIKGVNAAALRLGIDAQGFTMATKDTADGVHVIIYSLDGDALPAGSNVIVDITSGDADVTAVVLSDRQARPISVAKASTSGIQDMSATIIGDWTVTDVSGRVVLQGNGDTVAQIQAKAKAVGAAGVYILHHDAMSYKLIVK